MKFHFKPRRPSQWRGSVSMARLVSGGRHSKGEEVEWAPAPLPDGVELARDTSAGRWLEEAVSRRPFYSVGHLVPDMFEAYARVLHPALSGLYDEPVRWSAVAAKTGRVVHRLMQFERIAGLPDDPNARPRWGERPQDAPLAEIARALRPFTADPATCWIGLWEGSGGLGMVEELDGAPKVTIPERAYYLFRGPLEAVPAFASVGTPWVAPNLWWPDDRSWCVATDIDLDSTYVGGTRECIDALLSDPALEVFPSQSEDRIGVDADELNPAITHPRRRPPPPRGGQVGPGRWSTYAGDDPER